MNNTNNEQNKISQDELFEYLCYDKLCKNTRSELSYFTSKIVFDIINNQYSNISKQTDFDDMMVKRKAIVFNQNELLKNIKNNQYLINILNNNKSALDTSCINDIYEKLLSCREGTLLIIEKLNKNVLSIQACTNITQIILDKYEDLFHLWMTMAPNNKITKMKLNKHYKDRVDSYLVMSKL